MPGADRGDELAGLERRRASGCLRSAAGRARAAPARRSPSRERDDDGGAARGERGREIGRVRRDAVAGLEVVLAVVADLGEAGVAAAEPAVPLVAAVVPAAGVLAEVAADRALVAQERRRREAGRGGDGRVGRDELRRRRARRASSSRRSEPAAVGSDPSEPGVLQVDEQRRAREAAVDLPGEIGAAGEHRRARRASSSSSASSSDAGPRVRAHASASRTRARRQRQRRAAAAGRVGERVRDRRRGRDDRRLAEPLRADVRQVRVRDVGEVDHDLGHVRDRRAPCSRRGGR